MVLSKQYVMILYRAANRKENSILNDRH